MHDIEPYYKWRDRYIASEDKDSPFYGRVYDEFKFSQKIYNYYIHPQWDAFGSATLYLKVLYVDYGESYAIIELLGEWNDCLSNDIMFLKRELIDQLGKQGITKYILLCDNVMNFHGSDDCYYEEWFQDISENNGWIIALNLREHVEDEFKNMQLQYFINFGEQLNDIFWQGLSPTNLYQSLSQIFESNVKQLSY